MEEKKSKGGKREGAGRRPVADPKVPFAVYVPKSVIEGVDKVELSNKVIDYIFSVSPTMIRQNEKKDISTKNQNSKKHGNSSSGKQQSVSTEVQAGQPANVPTNAANDENGVSQEQRSDSEIRRLLDAEKYRLWDAVPKNLNRIQRIGWVSQQLDEFKTKHNIP